MDLFYLNSFLTIFPVQKAAMYSSRGQKGLKYYLRVEYKQAP
jgi:hypothetical protein